MQSNSSHGDQAAPRRFPWHLSVAYDAQSKNAFHREARSQLLLLAAHLGLEREQFDLRVNPGGIAVSGEITLHSDTLYVQVSQPCSGTLNGILVRCCRDRCDVTGGRNHFLDLALLEEPDTLAHRIARLQL
jgi:hypothetical protein